MVQTHAHPRAASRQDEGLVRHARLSLKVFPLQDRAFLRVVGRLLDELGARADPEPRSLEARLRPDYPRVRIVGRNLLAGDGVPGDDDAGGEEVWYVFRDGTQARAPLEFE